MCSPINKEFITQTKNINTEINVFNSNSQSIIEIKSIRKETQQNLSSISTIAPQVQHAVQAAWDKHPAYINLSTKEGEDTVKKLPFLPASSWLIRLSASQQCYVVTRKRTTQTIEHIVFSPQKTAKDLEKQFGFYSQIHFFQDILTYLNPSVPLYHRETASKFKYDYQLQLDLGTGATACYLEERAKARNIASCTLSLKQTEQELGTSSKSITRLTQCSRLYIIGHAHPGASAIYSEMKKDQTCDFAWDVNQLAVLISKNALHLVRRDDDGQRLKISLVVCHAGLNAVATRTSSFAVQLSKTLDLLRIPAEILARTNDIDIPLEGRFQKQVKGRHHALGDKVSVITRQGQTTIQVVSYE